MTPQSKQAALKAKLMAQRDFVLAKANSLEQQVVGLDIAINMIGAEPDDIEDDLITLQYADATTGKVQEAMNFFSYLCKKLPQMTPGRWVAQGGAGSRYGGDIELHPCFVGQLCAVDSEAGTTQEIISSSFALGVLGRTPDEAAANAYGIAAAVSVARLLFKDGKPDVALWRAVADALSRTDQATT